MRGPGKRVTVAQLRKHIDRRLRLKADKADLKALERRLDRRLGRKADKADLRALERRIDMRFGQVDDRFARIDVQTVGRSSLPPR